MAQLTVSYLYPARNTQTPIFISVKTRFAQDGHITVKLVNKILGEADNLLENCELGKNKELKGKEIKCTIDVADVQAATNKVGYVVGLKGGKFDQEFIMEGELPVGDPVMFYTVRILIF
jgi:hypothetical protein